MPNLKQKIKCFYNKNIGQLSKTNFVFWSTLIFYFLSLLNPNNKTVYLSFFLLWLIFFLKLKNYRLSLVLATVASIIFKIGKTWTFMLIPADKLATSDWPQGFTGSIVFTPLSVLSGLLAALIVRDLLFNQKEVRGKLYRIIKNKCYFFLMLYFLWILIASFFTSHQQIWPIIASVQYLGYLFLLIGIIFYRARGYLLPIISSLTLFESCLALIQWLKGSSLNVTVEQTNLWLSYARGPDQNFFMARSIGTFGHPNELGILCLYSLPIFFSLLYVKNKIDKKSFILFFASLLIGILSLSRSVWLSAYLVLLFFLYQVEKKWHRLLITKIKYRTVYFVYLIIAVMGVGLLVFPRLSKSIYLFQSESGGSARIQMIQESIDLIKRYPFFGTGIGFSPQSMIALKPWGIMSTFPTPVHNLYFLILNESGIPALAFFLLSLIFMFKNCYFKFKYSSVNDKIVTLGILSSLIAVLINGLANYFWMPGLMLIFLSYLNDGQKIF